MKTKNKLLLKLQKVQMPDYEKCHNAIGFNEIEIIEFNYDGQGNALVLEDGELGYYGPDWLRELFFSGWYKCEFNNVLITKN